MSNVQKLIGLYKAGKVPESTMLKMAAFKEEVEKLLAEDYLEKNANMKATIGNAVLLGALAAPAFAAGSYLTGKGIDMLEQQGLEMKYEDNFKRMLEYRPELKAEDQLLVKKYWDSLIHFAPAIAQDPLASGAYVKQAIQYEEVGGPPYSTIESLVKTQKTYKDANPLRAVGLGASIASNTNYK